MVWWCIQSSFNDKYFRVSGKVRSVVSLSTESLSSVVPPSSSILAPPRSSVILRVYRPFMTRFLAQKLLATGLGPVRSWVEWLIDQLNDIWKVPCDFNTPVAITFSGKAFQINPSTFNLGPESSGSSTCVGGFAASDGLGELTFLFVSLRLTDDRILGLRRCIPAKCVHCIRSWQ